MVLWEERGRQWFRVDKTFSSPSLHRLTQNRGIVQSPGKHKSLRLTGGGNVNADSLRPVFWFVFGPRQLLIAMVLQNYIIPPVSFSFQSPVLRAECPPQQTAPHSREHCVSLALCVSVRLFHFLVFYVNTSFWKMRTCQHPSGILFFIMKNHSPEARFYSVDRVRRSALTPNLINLL